MGKTDNTINENRTMLAPNHLLLKKRWLHIWEREFPVAKVPGS